MATKEEHMWSHANRAFEEADEAFKLFDEVVREQKGRLKTETTTTSDSHTLKFKAENWSQRRKLAKTFMKMATQILRTGATQMRFRR